MIFWIFYWLVAIGAWIVGGVAVDLWWDNHPDKDTGYRLGYTELIAAILFVGMCAAIWVFTIPVAACVWIIIGIAKRVSTSLDRQQISPPTTERQHP